jgi:hypothetical protein
MRDKGLTGGTRFFSREQIGVLAAMISYLAGPKWVTDIEQTSLY